MDQTSHNKSEQVGGLAGLGAGVIAGAQVGTVAVPVPVVGTFLGALVGGVVGSAIGQRVGAATLDGVNAFLDTLTGSGSTSKKADKDSETV